MSDVIAESPPITSSSKALSAFAVKTDPKLSAQEQILSAEDVARLARPVIDAFNKHGVKAWAVFGSAVFPLHKNEEARKLGRKPVYQPNVDSPDDIDFIIAKEEIVSANAALKAEGLLLQEIRHNPGGGYVSEAVGQTTIGHVVAGFRAKVDNQEIEFMSLKADGTPGPDWAEIHETTVSGLKLKHVDIYSHIPKYSLIRDEAKDEKVTRAREQFLDEIYRILEAKKAPV